MTEYEKQIRIRKDNRDWLREHSQGKTLSAFLDQIIDDYRTKHDKKLKKELQLTTKELTPQHISSVINKFTPINPTINFGNKTSRKACEDMIKRFGYKETLQMVDMAMAVQGQPYAPTITTPYQLREKLGALKIYFDRQRNRETKGVKI